jgi:hypothetical protein
MVNQHCINLSQQLLYAVKTGSSTEQLLLQVQQLEEATLLQQLNTDDTKKTFWLNIYNAYVQLALQHNPGLYSNRHTFYGKKFIGIACQSINLDMIEHGILRRSRHKWSLGYFGKPFPSLFEKKLRVNTIDCRIHFALNCGAKSCPPIAFYDPTRIAQQLNLAAASYLGTEAEYIAEENKVLLPALMSWFRADFGGKSGMKKILLQHNIIPPGADRSLRIAFKKYDWSLALTAYKDL